MDIITTRPAKRFSGWRKGLLIAGAVFVGLGVVYMLFMAAMVLLFVLSLASGNVSF